MFRTAKKPLAKTAHAGQSPAKTDTIFTTARATKTIPKTAARTAFRAARLCPDGKAALAINRFAFPMHAKISIISTRHRAPRNASAIRTRAAEPIAPYAPAHRYARAENAKPIAMPEKQHASIPLACPTAQTCKLRLKTAVRAAINAVSPIMPKRSIALPGIAHSIAKMIIINTSPFANRTIQTTAEAAETLARHRQTALPNAKTKHAACLATAVITNTTAFANRTIQTTAEAAETLARHRQTALPNAKTKHAACLATAVITNTTAFAKLTTTQIADTMPKNAQLPYSIMLWKQLAAKKAYAKLQNATLDMKFRRASYRVLKHAEALIVFAMTR